jgi:hypothetical protein
VGAAPEAGASEGSVAIDNRSMVFEANDPGDLGNSKRAHMRTETRNLRHPSVEIGFAIDPTIATEIIDQKVDVLVVAAGRDRECPTGPSHYQNFVTNRDSYRSPPIPSRACETRFAPSRGPIRCRAPPVKRSPVSVPIVGERLTPR